MTWTADYLRLPNSTVYVLRLSVSRERDRAIVPHKADIYTLSTLWWRSGRVRMRRLSALTCSFSSLMSAMVAKAIMYCLVRRGTGSCLWEREREGRERGICQVHYRRTNLARNTFTCWVNFRDQKGMWQCMYKGQNNRAQCAIKFPLIVTVSKYSPSIYRIHLKYKIWCSAMSEWKYILLWLVQVCKYGLQLYIILTYSHG